jgi:predicted ATPase/class 3 adenylate cyclase/Tfp pilus assembly protein PilF
MPFQSGLPTGTVTFLFTDIEASTRRWEQHPQQMSVALARHDLLLRQAIEDQGGYVFKTMGDAFCAAFPTPYHALQAALQAQAALYNEQWDEKTGPVRVRMALHTGVAEARDGDYFGQPLNRVARILSAGHGGQTLLSNATYDLVRDALPPGVHTLDLGAHRLKDLIRPEHIFQLVIPGLPGLPGLPYDFPPLRTLDYRPNNLPAQPTALIGREKELADLTAILHRDGTRLITLTGPGGTGKTRLALQAAADLLDDFSDGVWFVDLAPFIEPNLVISAIAQMLGVKETGGQPLIDTLKTYLKEKHLLLMLDNFEQVIDAANQVSQLLSSCSNIKVVVTSRIPLRIRGEKEYPVSPLQLPDLRHLPPLQRLTQYEAVRLFIERATDIEPDFEVNNNNAPSVAEICVRLDGLPLAIELAAARIRMLPPHSLLARLSQRLKLLTGGSRDLPGRQQTLRNTIEWSYDLLDEGQKQLFRRMAPFSGGRTLEALEGVCNYDGGLQVDVFEGAEALLSNNLIQQREGSDGEPRFWMLETIHEYAREKLEESGEAEALGKEHALYFMRLAEKAEPHLTGPKQQEWLNRLEDEHDNLRYALKWIREQVERGDCEATELVETVEIGLRTGGAIWFFWQVRGYFSEGREELAGLLSAATLLHQPRSPESKVKALIGAGSLAVFQGDYPAARIALEQALSIGREVRDKKSMALSLNILGNMSNALGDYSAARSLYEESLAIRRELGDKQGIAGSLNNLGNVSNMQGDYSAARSLYEESLAMQKELGDKRMIAYSLDNLGGVYSMQGDYPTARSLREQSLAIEKELGDKWGIATSLNSLGIVAYMQEDYPTARSLFEQSLAMHRELGNKWDIATTLNNLGIAAHGEGDYALARSLCEQSLAMHRELGNKAGIAYSLCHIGNAALFQEDYESAATHHAESLGILKDLGDKRVIPECLEGLASVALHQGRVERAARLWGAAEALREATGAPISPSFLADHNRTVAAARAQLDEAAWQAAWAEGRAMTMEQAITYSLEDTDD